MEQFYIHNSIRNIYPNVVTIMGEESFDINNNLVEIDMSVVKIEAEKLSKIIPITLNDKIQEQNEIITSLQKQINELKNK